MELVGLEQVAAAEEQVAGGELGERDPGEHERHPATAISTPPRMRSVQRTSPRSMSITANGTRKKEAFSIAFGTSAE
jgi:hypothetical protein